MNEEKIATRVGILGIILNILTVFFDGWLFISIWNTLVNNNDILFNLNYFNGLGIVFLLSFFSIKEKNSFYENSIEKTPNIDFICYVVTKIREILFLRIYILILTFIVNLFI